MNSKQRILMKDRRLLTGRWWPTLLKIKISSSETIIKLNKVFNIPVATLTADEETRLFILVKTVLYNEEIMSPNNNYRRVA